MGFVVDKVSEDSFYENLLLGLTKVLEKSVCVSNMYLHRMQGLRQVDIRSWEHNNGVILPEDMRAFYSSTNGFLFTYEFSSDTEKNVTLGKIEMNPLNQVVRTFGYETKNTAQIEKNGKKRKLSLSCESKVFEICPVDEFSKVVMVYVNSYSVPSFWLYNAQMNFSHLADDFTTYFRMCIGHLGIPCWQFAFSKDALPESSRVIFNLIAPGVLSEDRNLVELPKFNTDKINVIDPNIFATNQINAVAERANLKGFENTGKEKKPLKSALKRSASVRRKKPV